MALVLSRVFFRRQNDLRVFMVLALTLMLVFLYVCVQVDWCKMRKLIPFVLVQVFSFGSFVFSASTQAQNNVSLSDPSALHCINLGGKLESLRDGDKGERLLCVLANRRIDAWELFHKTHTNADSGLKIIKSDQ